MYRIPDNPIVKLHGKMKLGSRSSYSLAIKSTTWAKDSHSLFDYESPKITTENFLLPITTPNIALFRKRSSCRVLAVNPKEQETLDPEMYQFLIRMDLKPQEHCTLTLAFSNQAPKPKKMKADQLKTQQSMSNIKPKEEEEHYLIVRKQKDVLVTQKGCQILPGQCIKMGRAQFHVSELCINGTTTTARSVKNTLQDSRPIMKYNPAQSEHTKSACKICLEEKEETDNFLFNPCKCTGSCGTVHFQCLLQWIHFKVRKDVIGGTLHYNFQKFECEVCKSELPLLVETETGQLKELLIIQKPEDNYMILEGISDKSKGLIVVRNVPPTGIKLGRGNQCEIRVTDVSVSRNHSLIKFVDNNFMIFDNNSKFGTLVKQERLELQIKSRVHQGIQIGRTVLTFDLRKNHETKRQMANSQEEETMECYAE